MQARYKIEAQKNCLFHIQSLMLLYAPLIKPIATSVYLTLLSLDGSVIEQDLLLKQCHLSFGKWEEARSSLERFGLLKTYRNPLNHDHILALYSPLSGPVFLNHDMYGRALFSLVGSAHFDWLKMQFAKKEIDDAFVDISASFDAKVLDDWNSNQEELFSQKQTGIEGVENFDFDLFLKGLDRIFPLRQRTPETLSRIAKLALVHGISEVSMRRLVQRSIHPQTKRLNFETLHQLCIQTSKVDRKASEGYSISPVQFLQNKQPGIPVSSGDKQLIDILCTKYELPIEIVNCLIEYTLKQTNGQLPSTYVQKVATSWIRMGIDTLDKAKQQMQGQNKSSFVKQKTNDLPEWYANTKPEEADQDLLKQLQALQKEKKGETS